MADAKQTSHLNGAFYGPSVPPPQTYHSYGRRQSSCSPCCLLGTLIKILATLAIIAGIVILVGWLVLRPSKPKFYIQSASLTQFNLTDSNTLYYNLEMDIVARNPNKKIGIYYDRLEARAYYDGERFDWTPLPSFYQGHKNTTKFSTTLEGQNFVSLSNSQVADFSKQKADGYFDIEVKIHARMRLKVGSLKSKRFYPDIDCELRLPLATSNNSNVVFSGTKCDFDF